MLAFAQRQSLRRLKQTHSNGPLCHAFRPAHVSRAQSTSSPIERVRKPDARSPLKSWIVLPTTLLLFCGAGIWAYDNYQPFRHTALAVVRCSRIAEAAVLGVIDYKAIMSKTYDSDEALDEAYSKCHRRSAERLLKALLANGGVFIKLGQHMASLVVLPAEWRDTMRPLQDRCDPTPYENIEQLVLSDMGKPINDVFDEFDPNPIGVASLAQVHIGRLKESGQMVAIKLQHPHLQEFADIDMEMVEVSLGWIKHLFPEFEFTWLGEEMRENLPKEMDFKNEAANAERTVHNFQDVRTSLYIPKVIVADKRILVMEYIQGGRVDDLPYLAEQNIDRNKVSLELARIFSRMVYIDGWFHADPHPGNLLIRPAPSNSTSPYNFEIVLLDHGLYFDLDTTLRVNYAKLWLALMAPASDATKVERRKYAKLVGNIDDDLYPVFESAITGRIALKDSWDDVESSGNTSIKRASSMQELSAADEQELEVIRNAVMQQEGILLSVFDVLRRVPRRVLMVLKLNDLTRSLDHALATTHSPVRVFLIMARYCTYAVWQDDRLRLLSEVRQRGLLSWFGDYFRSWWRYEISYQSLAIIETWMDMQARLVQMKAWVRGLVAIGGLEGAHKAAAGIA